MKKNRRILAMMIIFIILTQSVCFLYAAEPTAQEGQEQQSMQEPDTDPDTDTDTDPDKKPDADPEADPDKAADLEENEQADTKPADIREEQVPEKSDWELQAEKELSALTDKETVLALVYLCDSYAVKEKADIESKTLYSVPSGTTVQIMGADMDADGNRWYRVSVLSGSAGRIGFIEKKYLAYSNEDLLEWENTYYPKRMFFSAKKAASVSYEDVAVFPESYQEALLSLKRNHPNWIFVKQDTGLNWKTVISREDAGELNLTNSKNSAYQDGYYGSGWYYASTAAVEYYMDPRNFLDETRIFQFEQLTFNSSYHTKDAVQNILNNTFMSGVMDGGMTYADAFYQIGTNLLVSPFHLACRVYQEQGQGTSPLISGTYPGYSGYYNYFNVGASGKTTEEIVKSGLEKAKYYGWNTRYLSLKGGASILSVNYILKGQDTLYLQKFNVDGRYHTLYTHQYMQNVMAPYSEAGMVQNAYSNTDSLNSPFVFKIPVYQNMPAEACPKPETIPTATPTPTGTAQPTAAPTSTPAPTAKPTSTPAPTAKPTATPSSTPIPTAKPTTTPAATVKPTSTPAPTAKPTSTPSSTPIPTAKPTTTPAATVKPTSTPAPTAKPISTPAATAKPTATSTAIPSSTPMPTAKPAAIATAAPTATVKPTTTPTAMVNPTSTPADIVKPAATMTPTAVPAATSKPTAAPTETAKPTATAKPAATATAAPTATVKPTATPLQLPGGEPIPTVVPAAATAVPEKTLPVQEPEKQNTAIQESEITGSEQVIDRSMEEQIVQSKPAVAAVTPAPQTAQKKEAIIMDMAGVDRIYAQTLRQVKEQGAEVILKMSDDVSWTIHGDHMESDEFTDIDLDVTIGESRIPKDKLNALTENEIYVELSLAHEGEFGFTAILTIKLEEARQGQYANLFYYNEETGEFEFMCASVVSATKEAAFEFNHASDYVIIISEGSRENLLTEKQSAFEQIRQKEMEKAQQEVEIQPAQEPKKAAGMILLILLGSVAVVLFICLIVMCAAIRKKR